MLTSGQWNPMLNAQQDPMPNAQMHIFRAQQMHSHRADQIYQYRLGKVRILNHAQFLCQFYELRNLNMRTGVGGCGFVVWFGKYMDTASLVLLLVLPRLDYLPPNNRKQNLQNNNQSIIDLSTACEWVTLLLKQQHLSRQQQQQGLLEFCSGSGCPLRCRSTTAHALSRVWTSPSRCSAVTPPGHGHFEIVKCPQWHCISTWVVKPNPSSTHIHSVVVCQF